MTAETYERQQAARPELIIMDRLARDANINAAFRRILKREEQEERDGEQARNLRKRTL